LRHALTVIFFFFSTLPPGQRGQQYGRSKPDLRGEFRRGADQGRGVDPGRDVGTWQEDKIKAHKHTVYGVQCANGTGNRGMYPSPPGGSYNTDTSITGDAENLVRNVAYPAYIYAGRPA
jgi:phage-related tail fiber protein